MISNVSSQINDHYCIHYHRAGTTWIQQHIALNPKLFTKWPDDISLENCLLAGGGSSGVDQIRNLVCPYLLGDLFCGKKVIVWTRDPMEQYASFLSLLVNSQIAAANLVPNKDLIEYMLYTAVRDNIIMQRYTTTKTTQEYEYVSSGLVDLEKIKKCLAAMLDYSFGWQDHGFPHQYELMLMVAAGIDVEVKDISEMHQWYTDQGVPCCMGKLNETVYTSLTDDLPGLVETIRRSVFESSGISEGYTLSEWLELPNYINDWLINHTGKDVSIFEKKKNATDVLIDIIENYRDRITFYRQFSYTLKQADHTRYNVFDERLRDYLLSLIKPKILDKQTVEQDYVNLT